MSPKNQWILGITLALAMQATASLVGCATGQVQQVAVGVGKAVSVACGGCSILQETGACPASPTVAAFVPVASAVPTVPELAGAATADRSAASVAPAPYSVPKCAAPTQPWILNFEDVMDKRAAPKIECR